MLMMQVHVRISRIFNLDYFMSKISICTLHGLHVTTCATLTFVPQPLCLNDTIFPLSFAHPFRQTMSTFSGTVRDTRFLTPSPHTEEGTPTETSSTRQTADRWNGKPVNALSLGERTQRVTRRTISPLSVTLDGWKVELVEGLNLAHRIYDAWRLGADMLGPDRCTQECYLLPGRERSPLCYWNGLKERHAADPNEFMTFPFLHMQLGLPKEIINRI